MKFARITFLVAGLYGIVALTPLYFAESLVGRLFPPPVNHPEFYYGFLGVVILFHVLYLLISQSPARYRPLMLLGAAEKFLFGLPTVLLYVQGRVAPPILVAALVDIAFGVLFVMAHRATSSLPSSTASWQAA